MLYYPNLRVPYLGEDWAEICQACFFDQRRTKFDVNSLKFSYTFPKIGDAST